MLTYGPTTALIVVDMQNDFADPAGSLSVRGGEAVVGRVNDQVQRAVGAGASVFYTQDWHPVSTPHFAKDGGIWPVHCVADTWGADFHPSLIVAGECVRKGRDGEDGYSGFMMRHPTSGDERSTGLEAMLRASHVTEVVVCGLATDYCVRATALDAVRLGFQATLLTDAVAAVDLAPGDGERALAEMSVAGITLEPAAPGDAGIGSD